MFSTGAAGADVITLGLFGKGVDALANRAGGDWEHLLNRDSPGYKAVEIGSMATLLGVVKHAGREALEEGGERVARNFPRPPATNPSLDRTMQQLFRAEDQYLGGTAEAIRRGDGHIIKGKERVRRLEKILRREPLGDADRATANRVRNDLIDALKSQGEWPR